VSRSHRNAGLNQLGPKRWVEDGLKLKRTGMKQHHALVSLTGEDKAAIDAWRKRHGIVSVDYEIARRELITLKNAWHAGRRKVTPSLPKLNLPPLLDEQ